MLREIFLTLENHLSTSIAALKLVDWDLQQYGQQGEDAVRTTPAAYIEFQDITWMTLNRYIQRGVMELEVTLVSQSAYGDKKDMTDTTYINHLAIERDIYKALQGRRFVLSDVPGVTLEETDDDPVIVETIERIQRTHHNELDALVVTTQRFRANVFDYSAHPDYERVTAGLDLEIQLVNNINDQYDINDDNDDDDDE
jgi:hypothetical protein